MMGVIGRKKKKKQSWIDLQRNKDGSNKSLSFLFLWKIFRYVYNKLLVVDNLS